MILLRHEILTNSCLFQLSDGRVNGSLAIARALGDVDIQPFVSHVPDVSMVRE